VNIYELIYLCKNFQDACKSITTFAIDAQFRRKGKGTFLDVDIEQHIRAPLTAILPNLIFAVNCLVDNIGFTFLRHLPELARTLLSTGSLISSLIRMIPPSRMKSYPSVTEAVRKNSVVVESLHPYLAYTNKLFTVSIIGAKSISVVFDPQTRTEHSYDWVRFWKDREKKVPVGKGEKFSGRDRDGNWPGLNGRPPLVVDSDTFYIEWVTDGSNEDCKWDER